MTTEPSDFLWRFYGTVGAVARLQSNEEREEAIRSYLRLEKQHEQEERDSAGLLPMFDELLEKLRTMTPEELQALQAEAEDSGAADQLRLFTRGDTG